MQEATTKYSAKCERCGHKWLSRFRVPNRCPKCKNSPRYAEQGESRICHMCGYLWIDRPRAHRRPRQRCPNQSCGAFVTA